MSRNFSPSASSTSDGSDLTLCRILEAVSGTAYDYELSDYVAADKPGMVVIKDGGQVIKTLIISYDGSNNITSITRA